MKLQHLETHFVPVNHRGGWLFVRLHTDTGLIGIGEASHSGDDRLCASLLRAMGERLQGRELLDIQPRWYELLPLADGRWGQTAVSAIEQALWDLLGRATGQPVHRLLGGAVKDRLLLYANINRGNEERTPASFARRAEEARYAGFSAIKLAPFDEVDGKVQSDGEQWQAARPGLERVAAVRAELGGKTALFVDCHWRFTLRTATRIAERLAEMDVIWFEDPVDPHDYGSYHALSEVCRMQVVGGETLWGVQEFGRMIAAEGVQVIMPDVKHCGGIAMARRIATMAEAFQITPSLHNPSGPVSTAASAHVTATLLRAIFLEYQWDEVPWRAELVEPGERISDGYLELSDAPGLGIRLNEKLLRKLETPP